MLLNYAVYSNPTSHKDILQKVKTFAVTQGWNVILEELNREWLWDGGKYDWLAGNEDFLWLSSTGNGAQDINIRFRAYGDGLDAQHEQFDVTGIDPLNKTINDASATHPCIQNEKIPGTIAHRMSLSPGTSTKLWVFGNEYFIYAINQLASDFVQSFGFGSPQLYDSSETEMMWCITGQYSQNFYKWYQYAIQPTYFHTPHNYQGNDVGSNQYYPFYWETLGVAQTRSRISTYFTTTDGWLGAFNRLHYCVTLNEFTGKRVLIKPTIYHKWIATDGLWRPAGTFPLYHIQYSNLQIGQVLDYGGESYMCFPNALATRKYGVAFRIA